VTVLDTIVYDDEIEAIKHDYPQSDLKVVVGDIRNLQNLGSAMRDAKGVIHLAAVSRVLWCLENQEDCTDVNVRGTQLVIEALKGGWLIQASSREVRNLQPEARSSNTLSRYMATSTTFQSRRARPANLQMYMASPRPRPRTSSPTTSTRSRTAETGDSTPSSYVSPTCTDPQRITQRG
jgi:nucleoside-diphosphate-sugar epimerase